MILLALSLFFTDPLPLDMPRAEAFLVHGESETRLEDRYNRQDLWLSRALIGRWMDDADRVFMLFSLAICPPAVDWNSSVTRVEYDADRVPMPRVRTNAGFPRAFREAVAILSTCPVVEKPLPPRQLPRGYKYVYYWQHPTNRTDIVCTFRPEGTNVWYLANWKLAPADDFPTQMTAFEDRFLREEFKPFMAMQPAADRLPSATRTSSITERECLRQDVRHAVAAYPNWHFTGAEEFAVVDNLPARGFIDALTNDFPMMRAKYAAAVPTSLNGSNTLSVVRIYSSRDEYLDALEATGLTNMEWSAAYWSSTRRELVAHLSAGGEKELVRTIRHEAFHQYFSYATAMIPTSPWLNEGYAQYFEDEADLSWGSGFDLSDEGIDRLAQSIPSVLQMDYGQFYEGTDLERRLKYRLAWSLACFIEKGADEVRLKPFAGFKERYMKSLIETHDMRKATAAAFKNADLLKKFIAEWKAFWKAK